MLHELALQKKLPKHQFMDRPTLDWIFETGKQRFGAPTVMHLSSRIETLMKLAAPSETFFTDSAIARGIHGYRHCTRVSLLAAQVYISLVEQPRADILKTVMIAGSLHDCRRLNDNADEGHGARAADWLVLNESMALGWFGPDARDACMPWSIIGIRYHEGDMPGNLNEDEKLVVNLIRTADALDRYRQPIEKWWINDDYLAIRPPHSLKALAWNLVCATESKYLDTQDNQQALKAVLEACIYE